MEAKNEPKNKAKHEYSPSLTKLCQAISSYKKPGLLTPKECNEVALILVELMVDGVDRDTLKFAARFLRPDDYEDIIEERNILHLCGYPLCNKDPKGMRSNHQINWRRPTMILPSTYLSRFCTREHYQASEFYEHQLAVTPMFSRDDITCLAYGESDYELQIALLEEVQELSDESNKPMKEIIEQFKSLSLTLNRSKSQTRLPTDAYLVSLSEEIKKFTLAGERDPSVPRLDVGEDPNEDDDDGYASHAMIEGYQSKH